MPRISLNHVAYVAQVSRRRAQQWAREGVITVGTDRLVDTAELVTKGLCRPERAGLPLPRRHHQHLLGDLLTGQQDVLSLLSQVVEELRAIRDLLSGRQGSPC